MEKNFTIYDFTGIETFTRPKNLTPEPIITYENWLFYVYSGSLHYKQDNFETDLVAGNLYILPSHRKILLSDKDTPFKHLNFSFTSSYIFNNLVCFEIIPDSLPYNLLGLMAKHIKKRDFNALGILFEALFTSLNIQGNQTDTLLREMRKYINDNTPNVSVEKVCNHFNYSKRYIDKKFTEVFNCTLKKYIKGKNFSYVLHALNEGKSLNAICDELNYSSPSNLSRDFKKYYGHSPLHGYQSKNLK